jgi:hypothetical protein
VVVVVVVVTTLRMRVIKGWTRVKDETRKAYVVVFTEGARTRVGL